ncbi:MAG: hypothetical protein HQM06_17725, partial [Magnetococcales bacterium]|nr:hypothetical protein [Magnetococcales bacterium]
MSRNKFDDLWLRKLGRLQSDGTDEVSRILFDLQIPESPNEFTTSAPQLSKRALATRARTFTDGERYSNGTQAVVKSAGHRFTLRGSQTTLRYVARERVQDKRQGLNFDIRIFDEFGKELTYTQAKEVVDLWDEDGKNRSIHSWHIILSLPICDTPDEQERFRKTCRKFIDKIFAEKMFNVIWTIHKDKPEHLHAHVLLRSKPLLGNKWRFDRHGDVFDTLRAEFARFANLHGFRVNASRREDRAMLRDKIACGEEPLRTPRSRTAWQHGSGLPEIRTPAWQRTFGRARSYVKPRPSILKTMVKLVSPQKTVQPGYSHPVEKLFASIYIDPRWALDSFCFMSLESSKKHNASHLPVSNYALWNLKNRPDLFGKLIEGQPKREAINLLIEGVKPLLVRLQNFEPAPRELDAKIRHNRTIKDRKDMRASLLRLADILEAEFQNNIKSKRIRTEADILMRLPIPDLPPHIATRPVIEAATDDMDRGRIMRRHNTPPTSGGSGAEPIAPPASHQDKIGK